MYMCKRTAGSYVSNQEARTNVADLFGNVRSDVGDVPHGHERVEAGHLLGLLDIRLVREAEVMGDGCQKHLHADDKILRRKGQFERFFHLFHLNQEEGPEWPCAG